MGTPRSSVDSKAIEQRLVRAGWELDGSFSVHLIVGHDGDNLSILAYSQAGETEEDPVFELIDHESNLTYGIQQIPSPQQAAQLLQEHGGPPTEEDSDGYRRP